MHFGIEKQITVILHAHISLMRIYLNFVFIACGARSPPLLPNTDTHIFVKDNQIELMAAL